ncbi:hypothetical protein TVAG_037070 [Trichomonas vaginalis G3]|uniref:Uncharacterized protein n=1 Tax=Trichomonas vaginalis (strain ATCC PRA-98 / G3) TaxID=412133 RepID=A2FH49_TRIV3|nr:hypothetical protein TVAGG3_0470250 [Trichomonas vaginalis G3]EAX95774.1 hypothetical protein TVAG_037070 [Trichomonas vaginalis G3]KAI5515007.1 hypothetical protein TVAGG3_0470250 [Trichomonas vaginalis G3]|eukprot:XP_001308704.1 hypothetical protein [Trichomonas vaginalis G3]
MSNDSIKWWNDFIGVQADDVIPLKPSVIELQQILFQKSPVITNGIENPSDNDTYWDDLHKFIMKLADDQSISHPISDFTSFVSSLHKISSLLKITNVKDAILLAKRLCPKEPADFFFNTFLFMVSDPLLAINVMFYMNAENIEPWTSQIRYPGQFEKFFDLFVTYLQPTGSQYDDNYIQFRIILSDMIVSLLCDPNIDFLMKERYIENTFVRLLNLVSYTTSDANTVFCRLIIKLFDYYVTIHTRIEDDILVMIQSIYTSSPPSKSSRNMTTEYIYSLCSRGTITHREAAIILTVGNMSIFDIKILYYIGLDNIEARSLVIKYLCEKFVNSKIDCYAIGPLISDLLRRERDKDINEFFKEFITKLFVKISVCGRKSKYVRRVLSICSLLSTYFHDLDDIWTHIESSANSAFLTGKSDFLRDYFKVGKTEKTNESFSKELSLFEKVRPLLKTYPFRQGNHKLYELDQNDGKVRPSKKQSKSTIKELKEMGIPDHLIKFFHITEQVSAISQMASIFEIEDFIDNKRDEVSQIKVRMKRPKLAKFNMDSYELEGRMPIVGQVTMMARNREKIYRFQIDTINKVINLAVEVIVTLKTYDGIIGDVYTLSSELTNLGKFDNKYKLLKERKVLLRKRCEYIQNKYRCKNYKAELVQVFFKQQLSFHEDVQYSSPSSFDTLVREVLSRSSHFKERFKTVSSEVENKSAEDIVLCAQSFIDDIANYLSLKRDSNLQVLDVVLIRLFFENSYYMNKRAQLANYQEYNKTFIVRSYKLSVQPIESLGISTKFIGKRRGMRICDFFRHSEERFPSVESISDKLCPLDINSLLYRVKKELEKRVDQSDIEPIFLGLLVTSPPNNAISAALSLEKFGVINNSTLFADARQLYINCVNMVFRLSNVKQV